jgi:hypothetical protein
MLVHCPRKQAFFDEPTNDVSGCNIDLLDERRRIRGRAQAQIAERGHLSSGSSGEADDVEALFPGGANRAQDV